VVERPTVRVAALHPGESGLHFCYDPERLEAARKSGSHRGLVLPVGRLLKAREAKGLLAAVPLTPPPGL
jgi:hypothetical protein